MAYKLKAKEPGFQVCREGEFEYHKFLPGKIYEKVPREEAHRFEEIGKAEIVMTPGRKNAKQEVKEDGTL